MIRIILFVSIILLTATTCTKNKSTSSKAAAKPTPIIKEHTVMTLEEAGKQLSRISGTELRIYSTYDFGRERDSNARSVIVAEDRSRQVMLDLRTKLGPDLIAFIGTTRWLGDETHEGREVVVAKAKSQFDILRLARSDAINYEMETEDLIKKLKQYDKQIGIDIIQAETDTIEFRLKNMPRDLAAFSKDLYEFCPDIVDQGVGSVEELQKVLQDQNEVILWWD